MIHEYFHKVHKCQSIARGMVACTRARMEALTRYWDRLELKFLRVSYLNNFLMYKYQNALVYQ